mmetsp:Transcript_172519/g.553066  ORF Transcript_172519/g.553066 Transcript_172519/m.553066 type:complete len:302 (+) Transcript_172519:175-1080(+)
MAQQRHRGFGRRVGPRHSGLGRGGDEGEGVGLADCPEGHRCSGEPRGAGGGQGTRGRGHIARACEFGEHVLREFRAPVLAEHSWSVPRRVCGLQPVRRVGAVEGSRRGPRLPEFGAGVWLESRRCARTPEEHEGCHRRHLPPVCWRPAAGRRRVSRSCARGPQGRLWRSFRRPQRRQARPQCRRDPSHLRHHFIHAAKVPLLLWGLRGRPRDGQCHARAPPQSSIHVRTGPPRARGSHADHAAGSAGRLQAARRYRGLRLRRMPCPKRQARGGTHQFHDHAGHRQDPRRRGRRALPLRRCV